MEALIILGALAVSVVWIFIAVEFQRIAAMKGHDLQRYFWYTFLMGPVGMLMVIALPQNTVEATVTGKLPDINIRKNEKEQIVTDHLPEI